jgi:hypothetical protein
MKTEASSKKALYQAIGFTLFLFAISFPLSILGIKLLNLVLGQIQL